MRLRPSWRRLTLRGRLTILVGVAVGVAVAAASISAWFLVRGQLREQVDSSLTAQAQQRGGLQLLFQNGGGSAQNSDRPPPPDQLNLRLELLDASGHPVNNNQNSNSAVSVLPIASADKKIAAKADGTSHMFRDGSLSDGTHVRIYTLSIVLRDNLTGASQFGAVMIARPLTETDDALSNLRLLLLVVSALGVVGASGAGLFVARAGLRPVDRLTSKAEEIARTEELGDPIEITGHDEVARLGIAFNEMTAALGASRERQQQLVADAGHELRTPLTSLRTNIELLIRSEANPGRLGDDDKERLLHDLDSQVDELSVLAAELVDLARGDRPVSKEPLDLAEPVTRAVERARVRAGSKATIEADIRPWPIVGDPALLERAVVNLLDNAVKFGPEGQTIRVALVDGVVSVLDQGPGIPEEDIPRVTERFYRATSSRSLPGSGLGLAIAAQVAQTHGGALHVANHLEGGALIRLALPGVVSTP